MVGRTWEHHQGRLGAGEGRAIQLTPKSGDSARTAKLPPDRIPELLKKHAARND
jgi:hypothetical protein